MNRVTVFERPDATSIFVEWHDDEGRHRRSFASLLGHPITDRELAKEAAHRMADAQERKRNQFAAEEIGIRRERTLEELLQRRHDDLEPKWSPKYAKSRERRRQFWLHKLGPTINLKMIRPAVVERIAREAQEQEGNSDRWRQDVLRYLVDSFIYARRKLKWIDERHDLSGVDIPSAKGKSRPYTLKEAKKLLPALYDVDPVAGWIGQVAFQTGRRLSAIRRLKRDQVETHGDVTVVRFPGDTDKARNTGEAVVVGLPARTDWTVPSAEVCNQWIHDAEELAGIEHVKGRAWHGLKRLYATLTHGVVGADKQSGTREDTLRDHYRQDILDPKAELARMLAERLEAE